MAKPPLAYLEQGYPHRNERNRINWLMRPSGRPNDVLRNISFDLQVSKHAEGSCLVKFGDTHVLCTATVETRLPSWLRDSGRGWITAEYGMLPRSTNERTSREAARGKQSGRTQEIQRLIGRSFRAVTSLNGMPELQIRIDCDVLQADGGTRTASITGGFLALHLAVDYAIVEKLLPASPLMDHVAAVSCGLYQNHAILDLDYAEDSSAEADANFVLTGSGGIVEIQATGEERPFTGNEFDQLFTMARHGTARLVELQKDALTRHRGA